MHYSNHGCKNIRMFSIIVLSFMTIFSYISSILYYVISYYVLDKLILNFNFEISNWFVKVFIFTENFFNSDKNILAKMRVTKNCILSFWSYSWIILDIFADKILETHCWITRELTFPTYPIYFFDLNEIS